MKFTGLIKNNINPEKLRSKNFFKGIFDDRKKNFKSLSNLILKKKSISCPICNSKNIVQNFLDVSKKYKLQKCKKCELVFPNTNFKKYRNYTFEVYKNYSKQNHRKSIFNTQLYRKKTFIEERYKYCIERLFKKNKKINVLEYGCGFGLFLDILRKNKIICKGLEVDQNQINIARKRGLNVSDNSLNFEKKNTYNLCVMFDVLEHLTNPISIFKMLNKKIKKKGYVVCYSPNINSVAFDLMGKDQNQIYPFEHLFFFNKKSLEILAKKTGFKILSHETFGLDLIDYFLYLNFKDKKNYTKKFKNFINIVQPIIDKSGYANHFRVTFQKI